MEVIETSHGRERVQGLAKRWSPGLVNFVPALAYHFCLVLPAAFTQPGAHLLAEPCRKGGKSFCVRGGRSRAIGHKRTVSPGDEGKEPITNDVHKGLPLKQPRFMINCSYASVASCRYCNHFCFIPIQCYFTP